MDGYTITAPILRQIKTETAEFYRNAGYIAASVLLITMLTGTFIFWLTDGPMYVIYVSFETTQLISHLALVNCGMPGKMVVFLEAFLHMTRFNFFGNDPDIMNKFRQDFNGDDRPYNQIFSQATYSNTGFV